MRAIGNQLRSLPSKRVVPLSSIIDEDDNETSMGTVTLCRSPEDATGVLHCQMHSHALAHDNSQNFIAIRTAFIVKDMKSSACSYTFHATDDVPSAIAGVFSTGVYRRDSQAMTRRAPNMPPAALHSCSSLAGRRIRGRLEE